MMSNKDIQEMFDIVSNILQETTLEYQKEIYPEDLRASYIEINSELYFEYDIETDTFMFSNILKNIDKHFTALDKNKLKAFTEKTLYDYRE